MTLVITGGAGRRRSRRGNNSRRRASERGLRSNLGRRISNTRRNSSGRVGIKSLIGATVPLGTTEILSFTAHSISMRTHLTTAHSHLVRTLVGRRSRRRGRSSLRGLTRSCTRLGEIGVKSLHHGLVPKLFVPLVEPTESVINITNRVVIISSIRKISRSVCKLREINRVLGLIGSQIIRTTATENAALIFETTVPAFKATKSLLGLNHLELTRIIRVGRIDIIIGAVHTTVFVLHGNSRSEEADGSKRQQQGGMNLHGLVRL